jgi:subtilisin-like proprotein convertase family protein
MAQFIPTDTLFNKQWYLLNTGQTGAGPGNNDLDITSVWPDYTGKGVKVAVYDDGVDFNHVDLKDNYDHSLDAIIDGSPSEAHPLDPSQVGGSSGFNALNAHGTTLAGIIAAESNGIGTVGVAFDSSIVGVYAPVTGVRGNGVTPSTELIQAMQQLKTYDVADFAAGGSQFLDGQASPNLQTFYAAIQSAATDGRGGLGTILLNATHNSGPGFGGVDGNGSGFDANRFYIHVGGVQDTGDVVQYVTRGANMLVSGFTGPPVAPGSNSPHNIETTDISGSDGITSGDYTDTNGTSAASPQIAGVAALMLQANPNLGWRDVQTIFSLSAHHTGSAIGAPTLDPSETDPWEFNGADNWNGGGRHYSIDYGYGIANAHDAVRMAETWSMTGSPAATSANEATPSVTINSGGLAIPDNTGSSVTLHFNVTNNIRVEEVRLNLGVTHSRIQDLTITLTSPDGTTSKIFNPVSSEAGTGNSVTSWAFLSEEFRGELTQGDWKVVITDHVSGNTGTLGQSTLQLFGSSNIANSRYTYTDEFAQYGSLAGRDVITDIDSGNDTINAAAVTSNSTIDLNAGAISTIAGKPVTIALGSSIENAIGGDGDDTLTGNSLDNILAGGRGTNTLDGGSGDDTAAFLQSHDKYTIQRVGNTIVVTGTESKDTLTNIEHLKFSDITLDSTNLFAPQITSNGGSSTANTSVAENTTAITTVVATDQDPGTTLAYSIVGGADQGKFQINPTTGALSFISAPDFENPTDADHNNSYLVTVRASDGTLTADQAITVNVTNVNEAPHITSDGGGDTANVSVPENSTAVTIVVAADPDAGNTISYSIVGGDDQGKFTIDASTGALSFVSAPDFENPGDANHDNSYLVTVRASDGSLVDDQSITVNVTDVNETPKTVHWTASIDVAPHPAGWSPAGIGDFNHDATSDLAWFNPASGDLDLWELANGQWSASSDVGPHPAGYQPVGFGDYNHDGTSDVLWFNPTTRDVDLWEMSDGKWAASVSVGPHPAGYTPSGTGDFNGDGTSDVLWYNPTTRDVDIWEMSNGHWAASSGVGSHPTGYQPSVIGDFNGDGTSDIAWFNPTTGDVDIWKMANGNWAGSVSLGAHPAGYQPLAAADLNHDGISDIVWYNPTTNDVDVWLLNNNGQWSASVSLGAHPAGAVPVGVGDFDHNGVPDLMWRDTTTGHIDNWMLAFS